MPIACAAFFARRPLAGFDNRAIRSTVPPCLRIVRIAREAKRSALNYQAFHSGGIMKPQLLELCCGGLVRGGALQALSAAAPSIGVTGSSRGFRYCFSRRSARHCRRVPALLRAIVG
jgi:hypothetical protein